MKKHAGSAFTQNAGRMNDFNTWKPTTTETKWLLLSGASDPPKHINVSERRPRDSTESKAGGFLYGVSRDITSMTGALDQNKLELFNSVQNIRSTKEEAKAHIKDLFDACKSERKQPVIYYTGHGEAGTGNWCFRNGTIGIEELVFVRGCFYPLIISDCCFSGNWADYCLNKGIIGYHCLAACPYYTTAIDFKKEGGELTLYMTGQRESSEMKKVPVYSRNDDEKFPFENQIDSKNDFFYSHLKGNKKKLICHTIANNKISALFVKNESNCSSRWSYSTSYKDFVRSLRNNWNEGYRCVSFSCDDNGILIYCEKDYGTEQIYIHGQNTEIIYAEIEEGYNDGMIITGCGGYKSLWIIIMTKGLPDSNMKEYCAIQNSWGKCVTETQKKAKERCAIRTVCYNTGLKQYFISMRETSKGTLSTWFADGKVKEARNWVMKNQKEYQVDFMFKNPATMETLIHMETTDFPMSEPDLAFDFSMI